MFETIVIISLIVLAFAMFVYVFKEGGFSNHKQ